MSVSRGLIFNGPRIDSKTFDFIRIDRIHSDYKFGLIFNGPRIHSDLKISSD